MSNFAVLTHRIVIEPHPDADALECARIGGYRSIVKKGKFKTGDVVAYIPEAAILPRNMIDELELGNHLAGPNHNRVHAIKLRGVLSQGLVYPMLDYSVGVDVTDILGIIKYVPVIPSHFDGEVQTAFGNLIRYEIDDIKMHPEMFEDGEDVIFTEKIHGTWCVIGHQENSPLVTSKQLSAQGFVFITDVGRNDGNVYVNCYRSNRDNINELQSRLSADNVLVMGEIFGKNIQDLGYNRDSEDFRVFDIYVGDKEHGGYLSYDNMLEAANGLFQTVPELYSGPFSYEVMIEHTRGKSTLANHGREGVVIRPTIERGHPTLDRTIAKSTSEKHLLRKGATEYN